MAWSMNMTVVRKPWMLRPELRWNAGLQYAGVNFRQSMSRAHYPPLPASGNRRTYATADKAGFNITIPGREMTFGSTFYLPYILFGTYKWQGWPGHLEMVKSNMRAGFAYGIANYGG